MALDAHLTVKGDVQGDFPGTSRKSGREDTMEVWGFSHAVVSPRDAASGLPSGRQQHHALNIVKAVDKASPYFMNALSNNENLPQVTLQFYHPNPRTGAESQFFTIELMNASIASVEQEMLNNKYPENAHHELREHIAFVYQSITWENLEGNTTAATDWLVRSDDTGGG